MMACGVDSSEEERVVGGASDAMSGKITFFCKKTLLYHQPLAFPIHRESRSTPFSVLRATLQHSTSQTFQFSPPFQVCPAFLISPAFRPSDSSH